jgi:hypothetical protein
MNGSQPVTVKGPGGVPLSETNPAAQAVLRSGVSQLLSLISGEPVAHFPSEPLDAFNSPDSNRQFRAQPTALGRFICQPPDRWKLQVDRRRAQGEALEG